MWAFPYQGGICMQTNKTVRSGFLLAALGMVYGDIATSPLYVLKYIAAESGGAEENPFGG